MSSKAEFRAAETIPELSQQLHDERVPLMRFLGHVKDRIPDLTAWDLYAAAALREQMPEGFRAAETLAHRAAGIADALLAERTKREQAAVEAKKQAKD